MLTPWMSGVRIPHRPFNHSVRLPTACHTGISESERPTRRDISRFLTIIALAGWWGALTFYGLAVVPEGTEQLGSQTQGLVTQQVTRTLNLVGVAVALL